MRIALFFIWFISSFFQMVAIFGGIEVWLGWPYGQAGVTALFVGFTPGVGTIAAIISALKYLEWPLHLTVAAFLWPVFLYTFIAIVYFINRLASGPKQIVVDDSYPEGYDDPQNK